MDLKTTIINTLLSEAVERNGMIRNSSIFEDGYQKRDGRIIPKIHPTMNAYDHGHDYTTQTIEDAKSKGEVISGHRECKKDNPHPVGSEEHKQFNAGADKAKEDHLKDFK
jgi:hypothetical protein